MYIFGGGKKKKYFSLKRKFFLIIKNSILTLAENLCDANNENSSRIYFEYFYVVFCTSRDQCNLT